MFMKANMTRNINTVRCNVKISITKMRGTIYIQRTHMERNENPIYDYYMDAERENRDTQRYAKNDNQETVEINNQTESDGQEQE
jgi:hypothetical protein